MTHHTRWRGIALAHGYSSADCRWFARRVRFWVENEIGSNNTRGRSPMLGGGSGQERAGITLLSAMTGKADL